MANGTKMEVEKEKSRNEEDTMEMDGVDGVETLAAMASKGEEITSSRSQTKNRNLMGMA